MGTRYLLDTNIIIYFFKDIFSKDSSDFIANIIDSDINISVITRMELLSYNFEDSAEEQSIISFIDNANIYHLYEDIIERTIFIRKNYKIKLPDAIIAATALVNNFTIITRNTNDFNKINGIKTLNPFD